LDSGHQYNGGYLGAEVLLGPKAQSFSYVQVKVIGKDGGNTGECTRQSN
jgi:hypothetical protein